MMAKIFLVVLLLAVSCCRAAYLVFGPAPVDADFNKPVSLKCDSDEPIDIYFKDQKIVQNAKYNVARRVGIDLEVTIKNVEVGDIGSYTCKSSAATGASPPGTVKLQLKPYFVDNNKVFNKKLGTRAVVEFTILSDPRPDVTYQKKLPDGTFQTIAEIKSYGLMVVGKYSYGINKTNGHLTIFNAKLTDAAEYKVVTTFQRLTTSEGKLTLNVDAKPYIKAPPLPSYDFVSGTSAVIQCAFAKMPIEVKWDIKTKDSKRIVVTGTSEEYSVSERSLTISSVSPNLEGATLTCIGTNKLGSASASTYIRMVYVMPAISVSRNESTMEGLEKTLKCVASGNPKPRVTWMKVNYDCTTMKLDQIQKPGESTFKIASASVSDAGTYKCVAVISAKPTLKDEAIIKLNVLTDEDEKQWRNVKKTFITCLKKKVLMIQLGLPTVRLPECKHFHQLQLLQHRAANSKNEMSRVNADQSFANSIVPILRKLPAKKNRLAKIEIQQVLFKYEFKDNNQ